MKRNRFLLYGLIAGVFVLPGTSLAAQSEEDLFGAGTAVVTPAPPAPADTSSGLLRTDTVKIGGSFFFEPGLTETLESSPAYPTPLVSSYADLFADARPKDDFRFFVKGRLSYPYTQTDSFTLREAFADFQPATDWYVRAGKQTANWGLGYYFSPGNLLDFTPINPEDPTAERTGPLALRVQKPWGKDNYYLYLLLDDAYSGGPVGIAPKAEWVVGSTELVLGGVYKQNAPWALTGGASFPLAALDVFVEGALRGNETKNFVVPHGPLVTVENRSDQVFPQGTVGFSWVQDDPEGRYTLTLRTQYYYNSEGYDTSSVFIDHPSQIAMLIQQGKLGYSDLWQWGTHHGAATVMVSNILRSDIGVALFWIGNLGDGSGKTSVTTTWDRLKYLTLSLSYGYLYGTQGSEYYPPSALAPGSLTLKATLKDSIF